MIDTDNISQLYLPASVMLPLLLFIFMIAVMYLLMWLVNNKELDIEQVHIYMFKFFAYGIFAYIIYIFYRNRKYIDITTLFTFIFCSIEAAHNFVVSIGAWLVSLCKFNFKAGLIVIMASLIFFMIVPWKETNNSVENFLYRVIEKEKKQLKTE